LITKKELKTIDFMFLVCYINKVANLSKPKLQLGFMLTQVA